MVNAPVRVKRLPAKAVNIEYLLDVILQVLNIISQVMNIFGISF